MAPDRLSRLPPAHTLQETGLDQYAIVRYTEALEVVPRTIAENSGLNATEAVAALYTAHAAGQANAGLDVETGACAAGGGPEPSTIRCCRRLHTLAQRELDLAACSRRSSHHAGRNELAARGNCGLNSPA